MSEVPSVLICGAGSRGRKVYGRFISAHPELARIVAMADSLPDRLAAAGAEHGLHQDMLFSSWQEAAAQPKMADIVIVATDDRQHLEPALAFLEAGYHLLLEKPMAPSLEDCRRIVAAAERAPGYSAVCHVLRYSTYFRTLKQMIDHGAVGRPLMIRHMEPVNFWHFAHSFVRGNWRNEAQSSPFILAKCCHDMDLLLYLSGQKPTALHSFGSLSHFSAEHGPAERSDRCLTCAVEANCPYSAKQFYHEHLNLGSQGWPLDVVVEEFSAEALDQALLTGPYGRCVYDCDNDVVDQQVVQVQFDGGLIGSLVATAFTDHRQRETEILGSTGSLVGDGKTILHTDFLTRATTRHRIESEGFHLGGDNAMLREFFSAVAQGRPELISTSPGVSLDSHLMALYAEQSRRSGQVVRFDGR